jgi:type II secretory pathway component PulJ
MHRPKSYALTSAVQQYGFTLLEMVLSTGLGALIMIAITASLLQFNQHKLLTQVIVQSQSQAQLAVAQLLADWRNVCSAGVTSGTAQSIDLSRQNQGRCISYNYAHDSSGHSLTRRRFGGRNSGFLAQVESVDFYYGVDSDKDCHIDHWRRSYQTSEFTDLHQVRVRLQMRTPASRQLRIGNTSLWIWHEDDHVVIHPADFIWRVLDVCP